MSYLEQSKKLAGPISLLKFQATRVAHNVSDDACQIFGGRGITRTGMGRSIESFQRTYKFAVSDNVLVSVPYYTSLIMVLRRQFWVALRKSWLIWVSDKQ